MKNSSRSNPIMTSFQIIWMFSFGYKKKKRKSNQNIVTPFFLGRRDCGSTTKKNINFIIY